MSDAHHHDHDHPAHLAHHFDTSEQQLESHKLGMWVFLATEILMFGGLFCAYSVYRGNHPEIFLFAHQYLDTTWGAINTAVLLASSFTMAWGVRASQLGQTRLLVALLCVTLLGGAGFMVIKSIEYEGKYSHDIWVGGINGFYQTGGELMNPDGAEHALKYLEKKQKKKYGTAGHGDEYGDHEGDHGKEKDGYAKADDHGKDGHVDEAHAKADSHADNAEHHDDGHKEDSYGGDKYAEATAEPLSTPAAPPVIEVSTIVRPAYAQAGLIDSLADGRVDIPTGPQSFATGIGARQIEHHGSHYPEFDELAPLQANATHIFFQIYFMMTGLHGIHVLIGMGLIAWVTYLSGGPIIKALVGPVASVGVAAFLVFVGMLVGFPVWLWVSIGVCIVAALVSGGLNFAGLSGYGGPAFSPEYYTPVDLVGLYWHLVDLIWIFLFPLLYLIH
ncbi:MAG: hypothetical protein AAGH99_03415 [Planctomycetota bacterium]